MKEKNAYYTLREKEAFCRRLFAAFGLDSTGHIINGHTPVKSEKRRDANQANGHLLVIDGGLSRSYQGSYRYRRLHTACYLILLG